MIENSHEPARGTSNQHEGFPEWLCCSTDGKLTNWQVGEAKNQENHQRTNRHLSRSMSQFPTLLARCVLYIYSHRRSKYISTISTAEHAIVAFLQVRGIFKVSLGLLSGFI